MEVNESNKTEKVLVYIKEYLKYTFNFIQEIAREWWQKYELRDKSFIVEMCYLQMKTTVTCQHCKHANRKYEVVSQLTLPIRKEENKTTMYDCLHLFTSEKTSESIE